MHRSIASRSRSFLITLTYNYLLSLLSPSAFPVFTCHCRQHKSVPVSMILPSAVTNFDRGPGQYRPPMGSIATSCGFGSWIHNLALNRVDYRSSLISILSALSSRQTATGFTGHRPCRLNPQIQTVETIILYNRVSASSSLYHWLPLSGHTTGNGTGLDLVYTENRQRFLRPCSDRSLG